MLNYFILLLLQEKHVVKVNKLIKVDGTINADNRGICSLYEGSYNALLCILVLQIIYV